MLHVRRGHGPARPGGKQEISGTGGAHPPGLELHTLLGQVAYRLARAPGYALVASQDRDLFGTSTQQLAELLRASAPCLILLDETLEYLGKALAVGTGETNLAAIMLTFIKELCTAVSSVPGAALVITLTGSHLEDYSATGGREELYQRLSKVLGREERIVTPVEGDDVFPILHRRLFQTVGPEGMRRQVAESYARYYHELGDAVPTSYRDASYQDRMVSAYPFHPELVDLLTNRWASLTKFQRTRGALRLLSHTVKALWRQGHRAPLIHVGDVPLDDTGVCDQVLSVAGEGYKPALNADIIRPDSRAPQEDHRRGGIAEELALGTAIATTAFLHSHGADRFLGASTAQLLVGVGRPGLHRGWIDDVRDSLESLLFYMRLEAGRYRFATEPNLNKVIVEREDSIDDNTILGLLHQAVEEGARGEPLLSPTRGASPLECCTSRTPSVRRALTRRRRWSMRS
jgi:predicted AAA+ superfamily ATPase